MITMTKPPSEAIVSKDKRIDLTQFEGVTEGKWVIMDKIGEIWRADGPEPYCILSVYHSPPIRPSEEDLRLMAAGPDLIAELNKMYKREDALFNAIKELRDSEDSTGCSEDLTVVHLSAMQTLYELFPNTAYWGCACQGPHTGPC